MVIICLLLQKTSHNIFISFKKNHHSIISSSCTFLIQSSPQIDKTISNPSKRCSSNFNNQNITKGTRWDVRKQPLKPGTHITACVVLHFSPQHRVARPTSLVGTGNPINGFPLENSHLNTSKISFFYLN